MDIKEKRRRLARRKKRIRVKGTKKVPRLSVYRSLKHIYAQLIDDQKGEVLVSASDLEIKRKRASLEKNKKLFPRRKERIAFEIGRVIAQKAQRKGVQKIVFDRGGRLYHGRIKALAMGAREGGLKF